MCGLTGFYFTPGGEPRLSSYRIFTAAFILSQLRGFDSAGIACGWRQKAKTGNGIRRGWTVVKDVTSPYETIRITEKHIDKTHGTKELLEKYSEPYVYTAIGHARAATKGDVTPKNAHPFSFGNHRFIGTHNGTLSNAPEVYKKLVKNKPLSHTTAPTKAMDKAYKSGIGVTDSEIVLYCIYRWGIEEVYPLIGGAWAFVWWDEQERKLYFIRNYMRTLFYFTSPRSDALFWSSEKEMLKYAVDRESGSSEYSTVLCKEFKPHHLYSINCKEYRNIPYTATDFHWADIENLSSLRPVASHDDKNNSNWGCMWGENYDDDWIVEKKDNKTTYKPKPVANIAQVPQKQLAIVPKKDFLKETIKSRYSVLQKRVIPESEWLEEQKTITYLDDPDQHNKDDDHPMYNTCMWCGMDVQESNDIKSLRVKGEGIVCGDCASDRDSVIAIMEGWDQVLDDPDWQRRFNEIDNKHQMKANQRKVH